MIIVEATYWPLVIVGAVPDSAGRDEPSVEEERLWSCGDIRLALVIRGDHARAWAAQDEVFQWLARHRDRLWRCVYRVAWIFEDELMRRNAERWLSLVGDRVFRGEITTFKSVRSALTWLEADEPTPADAFADTDAPVVMRRAAR